LLLVRLAADTGARRGELAGLRVGDLSGRVLTIRRAFSAGVLTTPKSGRARNVTLGAGTAALWRALVGQWSAREGRPVGPWLFSADPEHRVPARAERLGRWFDEVRDAAEVPEASLHRLRHSVATFLVARGQILQAQTRLGHADAATTLRVYAHALPGADLAVADAIEDHLAGGRDDTAPAPGGDDGLTV
jgi:integrase